MVFLAFPVFTLVPRTSDSTQDPSDDTPRMGRARQLGRTPLPSAAVANYKYKLFIYAVKRLAGSLGKSGKCGKRTTTHGDVRRTSDRTQRRERHRNGNDDDNDADQDQDSWMTTTTTTTITATRTRSQTGERKSMNFRKFVVLALVPLRRPKRGPLCLRFSNVCRAWR